MLQFDTELSFGDEFHAHGTGTTLATPIQCPPYVDVLVVDRCFWSQHRTIISPNNSNSNSYNWGYIHRIRIRIVQPYITAYVSARKS